MEKGLSLALISAALALSLGGCGLPGAVVVAGYAADGISYLATGKSATDHALSAAVDRDCALLRLAANEKPCRISEKNRRDERAARDAAMAEFVKSAVAEVPPGRIVLLGAPETMAQAGWGPPDAGLADAGPEPLLTPPLPRP
jgi:hypothetical protein